MDMPSKGAAPNSGRHPLRVSDGEPAVSSVRRLTSSTTFDGHVMNNSCVWPKWPKESKTERAYT